MKNWMRFLTSLVAVSCIAFCLCSCGNDAKTDGTKATTEIVATTEETVATTAETVTPTQETKATEAKAPAEISEDDAIQMIKDKYNFDEGYGYYLKGKVNIDGVSYYAVDLKKIMDTYSTYLTTYFVKTNGSEIVEGYYENDEPVLVD